MIWWRIGLNVANYLNRTGRVFLADYDFINENILDLGPILEPISADTENWDCIREQLWAIKEGLAEEIE